jgi:hypothetical protein
MAKWESYRRAKEIVMKKYKEFNLRRRSCCGFIVMAVLSLGLKKIYMNMDWQRKERKRKKKEEKT